MTNNRTFAAMKKDRLQKTALDYAKEYNLSLCIGLLRDIEVN